MGWPELSIERPEINQPDGKSEIGGKRGFWAGKRGKIRPGRRIEPAFGGVTGKKAQPAIPATFCSSAVGMVGGPFSFC